MAKQEFNPQVHEKLRENNIESAFDTNEALLYLLSLYYDLPAICFNQEIIRKTNLSKIVERDYNKQDTTPKWNINLFQEEEKIEEAWDWVDKEYRNLFGKIRLDAKGDKNGCTDKMKKFFSANPEVRKEDIILATKLYLDPFMANTQNIKYMQRADYFISKKIEGTKTSRLEQYLEQLKTYRKEHSGDNPRVKVIT